MVDLTPARIAVSTGVEVQQAGWVVQSQSFARRVAMVAVTGALDTGIGNEKRHRLDSVRGVCRVRASVPGCNT